MNLYFKTLVLTVTGLCFMQPVLPNKRGTVLKTLAVEQKDKGMRSITENAARAHVYFLADDLLEGREAGQRGSQIARQYIIAQMREAGVGPMFEDSYEQSFEAYGINRLHQRPRYYVEADSIEKIKTQEHCKMRLANVLAMIPGKRKDGYVVVGAHFDHEGMNMTIDGDKIYNGADDNASGVSAVLQIMKAFALSGVQPERNVVFAFWDGEEYGLLGSRCFMENFDDAGNVKAYVNFDMVGGNNRIDDPAYFVYFYTDSCPQYAEWLKADIKTYGLNLNPNCKAWDNPIGGSDQGSFARQGVPIIWYHTDAQPNYNHPSDEASTVNYPKLVDITKAAFAAVWRLANGK